jgi:hypothetical protein
LLYSEFFYPLHLIDVQQISQLHSSSGGSDDKDTIAAAVAGKDNIVPALVDSSRQS